ncbi:hypothetical protein EN852_009745 [Mesorhizobium sp. M2E.F.Ca.ET.209.01.1.1]|uniref:hypothetical protein n=1 Tax=Mesorhizobium sp. M2E.F.Ca.ET.209.01.1.1 TaxID=2500526 RepID=UPI000FDCDB3D|nr:hypothetical protein [Mesorhizobium sp. M2E.F.Ca.ET.209.01.1.1]TGS15906.1 hypothetical protein EN852_009745 [Mesorhizobium sp. M2E.F.Ca.ET.209.01.1.1]
MSAADRTCQHCNGSVAGKRRDAKFCSASCRVNSHRAEVGRVEAIRADVLIDRQMRDALVESLSLNPQDEHDPAKVREAFARMCRAFAEKFA